mmetsp:Transcript_169/g.459  ORF Transcript_169/g.459 Transcript_169/m.459 type:complete len:497 (-) Transcript_169:650-2140(-)
MKDFRRGPFPQSDGVLATAGTFIGSSAQYFSWVPHDAQSHMSDDDTQAKAYRRAMATRLRIRRTLVLYGGTVAICALVAWSSMADYDTPAPRVSHAAAFVYHQDKEFVSLVGKEAKGAPPVDRMAVSEDVQRSEPVPPAPRMDSALGLGGPPAPPPPPARPPSGTSCAQCSLNGICVPEGVCECQAQWAGPTCSKLAIMPQATEAAYQPGPAVYGAFPIRGDQYQYHLFLMQASDEKQSRSAKIIRASSQAPSKAYTMATVVVESPGRTLTDPFVVLLPTSQLYLMYYIELNCDPGSRGTCAHASSHIRVATTTNLTGPWTVSTNVLVTGKDLGLDGAQLVTPAVIIEEDESVLLYYRGPRGVGLAKASHWMGPYRRVAEGPLFDVPVMGIFVWKQDGSYHMLGALRQRSAQSVAIHGYSTDAIQWQLGSRGNASSGRPESPYGLLVEWSSRDRPTVLRRRDQPALLVEDGRPTYLFNTAQYSKASFVLATALKQG